MDCQLRWPKQIKSYVMKLFKNDLSRELTLKIQVYTFSTVRNLFTTIDDHNWSVTGVQQNVEFPYSPRRYLE